MDSRDRKRLEELKFSAEVIAKTEAVLSLWGVDELFARCTYCKKICFSPYLPKGKHMRKKLPADLFLRRELVGFRDESGEVICWPCDEFQFEYG
ncbi:hypothetical protein [Urbifossiella limnaea]|uniref:Uncharacterized protein n=1 Tax=Urbifossiella limnaea TaxID=2528023 RepID=A0A517XNA8_9BACT|nr:hypothetical protein [Urbifossiella limnaea]QDU18993.1 hypothetical protein ETAA1_08940 [Urbifossiella limnaea]